MAARNTDRVRYRYGICLNDNCEKCKSKEVQEIPARKDFVCQNPDCGKPLRECPPPKKGGNAKLIGIIAAVAAAMVIIGVIIALSGGDPKVEKLTLDKANVTIKPEQTERINVSIEPVEAHAELIWQSSDESVVSVLDGVVTAQKAGKATVKVFVKDQESTSAVCEFVVVKDDVDMETLDILGDPIMLRPGGHQQLTVKCTPEDQNEIIIWSSSDETIAKVSPRGKVEAIKVGQVYIIAKSDRTGVADTANVSVDGPAEMPTNKTSETTASANKPTIAPAKKPAVTQASKPAVQTKPAATPSPKPATAPASGSRNLGYAVFKGSWPNDVNGRMIFKASHLIDSKDPKKRVAEVGDYVIGEWSDGHLVQGIWYGANNQVKGSIIIGK